MRCAVRLIVVGVVGVISSKASAALTTIDNFDEYTNNQAIATSASSSPWLRFGSIGDNLYATNNPLLDGTLSAKIPVALTTAGGSATIRRNYGTATDLSSYSIVSVLSKSTAATSTAALQISIADATTTFLSTIPQAEGVTAQTFSFALTPSAFTVAAGTDSFATVLSSVASIGFRISNVSPATSTNETLVFDDFALQTSVPEPISGSLGLTGVAGLVLTRRRRPLKCF